MFNSAPSQCTQSCHKTLFRPLLGWLQKSNFQVSIVSFGYIQNCVSWGLPKAILSQLSNQPAALGPGLNVIHNLHQWASSAKLCCQVLGLCWVLPIKSNELLLHSLSLVVEINLAWAWAWAWAWTVTVMVTVTVTDYLFGWSQAEGEWLSLTSFVDVQNQQLNNLSEGPKLMPAALNHSSSSDQW